jgi:hypothetical protein
MKLLVTQDDATGVQAAYDLIQAIYASAPKLPKPLTESEMAVDINGMPRAFALGATRAFLKSQKQG